MSRLNDILRYLTTDIWRIPSEANQGVRHLLIETFKKLYLAVRFFIDKDVMAAASALTYSTMLAIVPILAVVFAIARGFGFNKYIEEWFLSTLSSQPQAADVIVGFVNSYLVHTHSGVILGIGLVFMLWTVIMLIHNIETTFNQIWQVSRQRPWSRKLTDYVAFFFFVPIVIILTSGLTIVLTTMAQQTEGYMLMGPVLRFFIALMPYVVMSAVFVLLYVFMPNTRVKVRHALVPGILAGVAMQLLQYFYIHGQMLLSGYNAIYGSFAALPLFMLWVQLSWTICLFGAELTYTSQNLGEYAFLAVPDEISHRYRLLLSTVLMSKICERKDQEQPAYTAFQLKMVTGLPIRIVSDLLHDMVDAGLLNAYYSDIDSEEAVYTPAVPIDHLTVGTIVDRLETRGKWTIDMDLEKLCDSPAWHKAIALRHQYLETLRSVEIREL